jgi:hypothetical protein
VARNIRISEADYNRKRRAIQISKGDPRNTQVADEIMKPPPTKISRLVQKLSPRALLAKRKQELSVAVESQKEKEKPSPLKKQALQRTMSNDV